MTDAPRKTDYAGDVSPSEAWSTLLSDPKARLVDVRSAAEWTYVGIPDLASTGREVLLVEYQSFPTGTIDSAFAAKMTSALQSAGADVQSPVLCLCRSGARSRAAAIILTQAGWSKAYNITSGFEGDLNEERHRGQKSGWKASGLPWKQS